MSTYRIVSSAGVEMGSFEAETAIAALDALAKEVGYDSHAASCEVTGEDPGDWTESREAFRGGTYALLVAEYVGVETIVASGPRASTNGVRDGVDVDVTLGLADGRTIEGEVTLAPAEYDGRYGSWGDLDMWMSGGMLEILRALPEQDRRANIWEIEAAASKVAQRYVDGGGEVGVDPHAEQTRNDATMERADYDV